MPFVLIKNNLKLMLRSKWILFMMIILPLITIALLANAFKEMLNTNHTVTEFAVGCRISDGSIYKAMMPQLKSICKENKAILQEYPAGDIEQILKSKTVAVFIDIKDDNSYKLYESEDYKTEAAVTESIFSGFFYQVNEAAAASAYGAGHKSAEIPAANEASVKSEVLNADPVPSSTDYYGIIYIAYFGCCGLCSLLAVASSERKGAVNKRMRAAHLPKLHYYIGKFIPCTLAVFIEICTALILSVVLFGIHWGNIGLSVLIIFLISMGSSAFGIVLFQLFHNAAISIASAFILIWAAGFFGGSFQTYMYTNLPQILIDLSPLYYINRTLVEFSTMGHSDYTGICIAVLAGIILFFGAAGILLMNRKMEEQ